MAWEQHTFEYRRHLIQVEREEDYENWYIRVVSPQGIKCYDGWWKNSADKTVKEAVAEAKRGACLVKAVSESPPSP